MTGTQWLSGAEERTWRDFLTAHARLATHLNRQLQADSALSLADFEVLVQLTDRDDERARAFELAGALQWERSRLSHQLTRMQRRGLLERQECPDDGRGAYIVLTGAGRAAIDQAAPRHVHTVRRVLFDRLSGEQLSHLAAITDAILQGLDAAEHIGEPAEHAAEEVAHR